MSNRYSVLINDHDGRVVKCQDCKWTGTACQTVPIRDLEERIAPGETVPAGECPECGALAALSKLDQTGDITIIDALCLAQATIERLTSIDPAKRNSVIGTLNVIAKVLQS